MAEGVERGLGKCSQDHIGSYGYPTRPARPYAFCPQCGRSMVWHCPSCAQPVPEDSAELLTARFCQYCGAAYFAGDGTAPQD